MTLGKALTVALLAVIIIAVVGGVGYILIAPIMAVGRL